MPEAGKHRSTQSVNIPEMACESVGRGSTSFIVMRRTIVQIRSRTDRRQHRRRCRFRHTLPATSEIRPRPDTTRHDMIIVKTLLLFVLTAIAEILGCYLPYLWLKKGASTWLLVPATASLAAFVWLLTLHPTAAGRVYAAYGGVYVATAIAWLWLVDGNQPTTWDLVGAAVALVGMTIIILGGHQA